MRIFNELLHFIEEIRNGHSIDNTVICTEAHLKLHAVLELHLV